MSGLNGILVLNKDKGMTSHACVSRVRKLFSIKKAGHTGTLDPDVTGVLPVCIGKATRLTEYVSDLPKAYRVRMKLGVATDTEDASGHEIERVAVSETLSEQDIVRVLQKRIGRQKQTPPMFSAVKIEGKKLYEWAREGKTIQRPEKEITIHRLDLIRVDREKDCVVIDCDVRCSKGTYVRTLCVDIGRDLGYPAHMSSLVRTESGSFTLEQSLSLEDLESQYESLRDGLLPMDRAVHHFPFTVTSDIERVQNGRWIQTSDLSRFENNEIIRVYASSGHFLALYRVKAENERYAAAEKVFL